MTVNYQTYNNSKIWCTSKHKRIYFTASFAVDAVTITFLNTLGNIRITLDQWDSFLLFNSNVKLDLSNYDEDGACTFPICALFFYWSLR